MGGKLTLTQMRVILLAGAVLLLVLAYFLGFQPNMDSASEYQVKTETAEKHIKELEALKSDVKNLEIFTSLYNDEIKDYINSFPVKMTQQKSVYLLYRMMINTEVDVTSITPGTESPFYYKGTGRFRKGYDVRDHCCRYGTDGRKRSFLYGGVVRYNKTDL